MMQNAWILRKATLSIAALTVISAALAQSGAIGTTAPGFLQLVDGGWTYRVDNTFSAAARTGVGGGLANYVRGATPDHLYQHWWWYRGRFTDAQGGSDSREFALSNLDVANSFAGAVSGQYAYGVLTYNEPVAGVANALRIRLSYAFDGIVGAPGTGTFQSLGVAILSVRWTITNTSGRPIEVNFFNYIDLDVFGPSGTGGSNDRARIDIWNPGASGIGGWIKIWDTTSPLTTPDTAPGFEGFNYVASSPHLVGYEVGTFGVTRPKLTNTSVDDLPNTTATYPADFAGAYQWRFILDPGQSADGWVNVAVNVPEPGSMIALGAGLASLLGLRRRRKR
ncbi:MAG: PEP-CTERM sorting domain-containing protein [Fimbriimonadales bacterium]|nr:PEP-CTERM sorting domain-containing protein [Fimbriimonadales bacterium]